MDVRVIAALVFGAAFVWLATLTVYVRDIRRTVDHILETNGIRDKIAAQLHEGLSAIELRDPKNRAALEARIAALEAAERREWNDGP